MISNKGCFVIVLTLLTSTASLTAVVLKLKST